VGFGLERDEPVEEIELEDEDELVKEEEVQIPEEEIEEINVESQGVHDDL
jgi:hypothetical protein